MKSASVIPHSAEMLAHVSLVAATTEYVHARRCKSLERTGRMKIRRIKKRNPLRYMIGR
jgi:hypothetical protein